VSFETIWAGWRNDYVVSATESERTGEDDACVFCRIAASGDPSPDNAWCGAAERRWWCSTSTPMRAGTCLAMPLRHLGDLEELDAAEAASCGTRSGASSVALRARMRLTASTSGRTWGGQRGPGSPPISICTPCPDGRADTNFMTSGRARVIPESLPVAWQKLHAAWPDA